MTQRIPEQKADFLARLAEYFRPPSRMSVADWAERYVLLPRGTTPEPGRLSFDRTPYLREPINETASPTVREIIFMGSAQVGKTVALIAALLYRIAQRPSVSLIGMPSEDLCSYVMTERLDPIIEATPVVRRLVAPPKARDSGNTASFKKFAGGSVTALSLGSASQAAARSASFLILDEIDRLKAALRAEGDPVKLLERRAATYADRCVLKASTPTIAGDSRIEAEFARSDQRRWHVPCPNCSVAEPLEWENVRWKAGKPQAATYGCPHCASEWSDDVRLRAVRKGFWRATNPDGEPGVVGFHINQLASPWSTLEAMVREYETAKDNPALLQTFRNLSLGIPHKIDEAANIVAADLLERAEDYAADVMPDDAYLVTAGVDVQHDRLEITFVAWGDSDEAWELEHLVLLGDPTAGAVWAQLDEALAREWPHPETGELFAVEAAVVDSGFATQTVYEHCAKHFRAGRQIYAGKGVAGQGRPIVKRSAAKLKAGGHLLLIGTDTAKDGLFQRWAKRPGETGCWHFREREAPYYEQLVAERRRIESARDGRQRHTWYLPTGARAEALDCAVYATAARYALTIDFNYRARRRAEARARAAVERAANVSQPQNTRPTIAEMARRLNGAREHGAF